MKKCSQNLDLDLESKKYRIKFGFESVLSQNIDLDLDFDKDVLTFLTLYRKATF